MESHASSDEPSPTNRVVKFDSTTASFSSSISQTPFALPFLRPSRGSHAPAVDISLIVKELKQLVTSTVDVGKEMIQCLVDANPVLNKLASVSSQFNEFFCQGSESLRLIDCCIGVSDLPMHNNKHRQNLSFRTGNFAAILPGDSVAGMVVTNGILNFLNIYNTILVVRLVLTWFPNAPPAIVSPLSTLCGPYLNIFRGLIPPLGGTLDLSPILAFLVLNAFTSTASALPAELPPAMRSQEASSVHEMHASYTTSQEKWIKRFRGNDKKTHGGLN